MRFSNLWLVAAARAAFPPGRAVPVLCAVGVALAACGSGEGDGAAPLPDPPGTGYVVAKLISDIGAPNDPGTDPLLVNGWGIALSPGAFAFVTNNGTSTSTLYDGDGLFSPLVVTLPAGMAGGARPTGAVFNDTESFQIKVDGRTGSCTLIVVGEGGTVACWAPNVTGLDEAVVVHDGAPRGAVYTGLAIASQGSERFLYAADFHNGTIDVFDTALDRVNVANAFLDRTVPAGYAPYGVQGVGDRVYVAYARQNPQGQGELTGAGLGLVNVFDMAGTLIRRQIPEGRELDAPWGMAIAPAFFGVFSGALIVSNFGDGMINAFDQATGAFLGSLSKSDGAPIVIEGLRGIAFDEGLLDQPPGEALYFVAGPDGGSHGVYGRIVSSSM